MSVKETLLVAKDHIEETAIIVKAVDEDLEDFTAILEVGQKFNGLVGSFAFYKAEDQGCLFVHNLAEMVDMISLHYSKDNEELVQSNHAHFLKKVVPYTVSLVERLCEGQAVDNGDVEALEDISAEFRDLWEVEEKETMDQSEIDKLVS